MSDEEKKLSNEIVGPDFLNCLRCGCVILARLKSVHNEFHKSLEKYETAAKIILAPSKN